ncbi:GNAT family N-acetyltransferase [Streptococcus dentasini]
MSEVLVQAGLAEVVELKNLFQKAYADNEARGIHFAAATINEDDLQDHLYSTPIFVKTEPLGRIIASTAVRFPWSKNPGPYCLPHLGWIATLPAYQNQGLAKSLVMDVIDHYLSRQFRAPAVTLGTAKEHPWLIEAYERMGFTYLDEKQLFSDHKTVYLIKILDKRALNQVKDDALKLLLTERKLV